MAEDAKPETHTQEQHAHAHQHAASQAKGPSYGVIAIIFVVVMLIVAFVSYNIGVNAGSSGSTGNNQQNNMSSINTIGQQSVATTIPQTTTNYTPPTPIKVGDFSEFILPSEAHELIGNSNYSATASTTPAQVQDSLSSLLPENSSYDITSEYVISYYTNSTVNVSGYKEPSGGVQEILLLSNNASGVYHKGLILYGSIFNKSQMGTDPNITDIMVGANTLSGMTYTYSESAYLLPKNEIAYGARLIGFKGNTTVFSQISNYNSTPAINITELASIIASHIG